MKWTFRTAIVGVAMLAAPYAYATDVTGAVRAVDTGQHQVALDNGKIYTVDPGVPLGNLRPGDKVTVSYSDVSDVWTSLGISGFITKISVTK